MIRTSEGPGHSVIVSLDSYERTQRLAQVMAGVELTPADVPAAAPESDVDKAA